MSNELMTKSDSVFAGTYARYPALMVKGEGCLLIDSKGKEYLDFLSGIAVCSLGHCHPAVTKAVCEQAGTLVHVSNLFYTLPQIELAGLLVENSFADKVFFANSGAEANEAAMKLARIHSGEGRYEIISLDGSFHGRTLAAVAATGQPKFHQGFEPMPDGFVAADLLSDIAAVDVLFLGREEKLKEEAEMNFERICDNILIQILTDYEFDFDDYDFIIDAMLGTGIEGELIEPLSSVVDLINESKATTL